MMERPDLSRIVIALLLLWLSGSVLAQDENRIDLSSMRGTLDRVTAQIDGASGGAAGRNRRNHQDGF